MTVCFLDLLFDPEARTLTRAGKPLHLSPKAFDLLALLIDSRPGVVRKREIVDSLWPDVFVEEANVRNLIAEIRDVLEDGSAPQCIRTLPRVGYAFCGDVRVAATRVACSLSAIDRDFTLTAGENVIGRADDCAVIIRASGVSRKHARITISRAGEALLEDLGSKNGTFLSECRISSPVPLHDGDSIRIGAAVLVFRSHVSAMSTTTLGRVGR